MSQFNNLFQALDYYFIYFSLIGRLFHLPYLFVYLFFDSCKIIIIGKDTHLYIYIYRVRVRYYFIVY